MLELHKIKLRKYENTLTKLIILMLQSNACVTLIILKNGSCFSKLDSRHGRNKMQRWPEILYEKYS